MGKGLAQALDSQPVETLTVSSLLRDSLFNPEVLVALTFLALWVCFLLGLASYYRFYREGTHQS